MKIKLLISRAGIKFSQSAGDIVDVSEDEADRLIRAGKAEPAAAKETATSKTPTRKAVKD